MVTDDNVKDVFTYHAPTPEQVVQYQEIREACENAARVILKNVPRCADQQAAIRCIREGMMTANAGIATKGAA